MCNLLTTHVLEGISERISAQMQEQCLYVHRTHLNPTTRLTPNKKPTLCCHVALELLEAYLSESAQHNIHQLYIIDVATGQTSATN